jgi:hypothetical protein
VPLEPEGRTARLWHQARSRRQRQPVSVWRWIVAVYPVALAGGFVDSADVPWYYHPFLIAFGAMLPLAAIAGFATVTANVFAERRARRLIRPRPRATYLLMALGWALAGAMGALLAWAAGARPGGGEDWMATGLVWATMISACATLMMIGRAVTVGTARGPAWLARRRTVRPANPSGAPAGPAVTDSGEAVPDAARPARPGSNPHSVG